MNDFSNLEKLIVRELSCRLCLCTDVVKLKPLSDELKRKIRRLFNINIRTNDNLPKAICHDCLHHVSTMYLYSVKVEKTQKFLIFHKSKAIENKKDAITDKNNESPTAATPIPQPPDTDTKSAKSPKSKSPDRTENHSGKKNESHQGDAKPPKSAIKKKASPDELKYMESMTLDEFANSEKVDKSLLESGSSIKKSRSERKEGKLQPAKPEPEPDFSHDTLDPIVLMDGRPARQGAALDRQITLFYKMECCICHEKGFHFKTLMKHYKERHGVPGYVTCCDKKFHYFYPKKIIEHMAYHLQPNIFMCPSCHHNFQTSQELNEHQTNGGRSEGKVLCPRCTEKYPTYRELGCHLVTHRSDKSQCDYCGKLLKHHHRKKTVNHMEDVILCSQCIRTLKAVEKQEKEMKEKLKVKSSDAVKLQRHQRFREALNLSAEDSSTD